MKIAAYYIQTNRSAEDNEAVYSQVCRLLTDQGVQIASAGKITDITQAQKTAAAVTETDADLLLLVVLSGLSAQLIEAIGTTSNIPLLIWAIGNNFSFPSSALASGVLREAGCLFKLVHGEPENEKTLSEVMDVIGVSRAVTRLRRSTIGLIGGLFSNLVSCRYDQTLIHAKFGIDFKPVSYEELQNLMADHDMMSVDELKDLENLSSSVHLRVPAATLEPGLKLHLALKHLAEKESIDAFATECWSGLPPALGINPCLGFIEDSYITACEGDVVACVMLLAMKYMTNQTPPVSDIQYIDEDNRAILSHCGASASLAGRGGDVILDKSATAEKQGFSTVTCRPALDEGLVTLVRMYGKNCEHMHIACGERIALDRSSSFSSYVKISGKREEFIEECLGNHYLAVQGDVRNRLRLFGKWMGIGIKET